jgi:hypothetical protein
MTVESRAMKSTIAILLAAVLIGCHGHGSSDTPANPPPPRESTSVQRTADNLDDYVTYVQGAQTQQQEADAIRALRKYEISNGLTYKIATFRPADNAVVTNASTTAQPVRAQVTVFRGRDVVRTFNFVPKDNRNLALFGE